MMYLIETNLFEATKKQYNFKLKVYIDLLFNLILVQIIGILFSLGGTSSSATSNNIFSFKITNYSNTIIFIFTIIVLFCYGIVIQTENYKKINKIIIENSYSSSFSDIAFILTLCIFAGITTFFSGIFLRVLFYFIKSSENIVNEGFFTSPQILFISIISIFFYAVLISSFGYFAGALIQIHKTFAIVLTAICIGIIFLRQTNPVISNITAGIYNFYCNETSLLIFTIKIIITSLIFFSAAVIVRTKLEVEK